MKCSRYKGTNVIVPINNKNLAYDIMFINTLTDREKDVLYISNTLLSARFGKFFVEGISTQTDVDNYNKILPILKKYDIEYLLDVGEFEDGYYSNGEFFSVANNTSI